MAKLLKKNKIQFIDTCGNAFLDHKPYYVYIIGNKADQNVKDNIRPTTGVALGVITQIIKNLKNEGYITERKRVRRLLYKEKLLDKWVEHYPTKLRQKQKYAELTVPIGEWWCNYPHEKFHVDWGGETGAALLTNHLVPEVHTVYVPIDAKHHFIRLANLKPTRNIDKRDTQVLELLDPFWPKDGKLFQTLVIYADLIQTGEARNIEIAKLIYKEHIVGHLERDW